jgi:FHA domain
MRQLPATFADYVGLSTTLSRAQFAGAWSVPFLVHDTFNDDELTGFATVLEKRDPKEKIFKAARRHEAQILPVRKSERNPFGEQIFVGRARNCDVVLASRQVSKLHAYFLKLPDGRWQVVDKDSANGTFCNRKRLAPGQPNVVRFGDEITLGFLPTFWMDSGNLFDWLQSR